jgi:Asp-tRNA(Asn)/Glu-tRNA(Gln) amidotransferase A subunit family amidase
MTEMHYWSATETLRLFRAKEVSPVEVLDAVATQINAVNGRVNAFSEQSLDEAYEAARESEKRYQAGCPQGTLDGLLVAAKDEHGMAGRAATGGSLLLEGVVADQTHPVLQRVLDAGGIIHARTTTPEFSLVPFTHTKRWGVTRNPWNLDCTSGGSSGGSAAALAAGMATLATGSDIGGSIRQPASFCGLVGFKPPFGRVPATPPFNQDSFCADGPLGRTVADVALLQNVIAGPHPHDNMTLRPKYVLPERFDDVRGMRVAVCVGLGDFVVDATVAQNTRNAARLLQEAGAVVEEVQLPWALETIEALVWAHMGRVVCGELALLPEEHRDLLMPYTLAFAEGVAEHAGRLSLSEALTAETLLYQPLGELLESFDALICPTWSTQGLPAGEDLINTPLPVNGGFTTWERSLMTVPFNIISRVPVLNVPSGLALNGVPTGVQIVGRTYDDVTPFRLGSALEAAQNLWDSEIWKPLL